ncbi:hypothetical protein FM120_08590 [Sphingobacterium faecium PCAi_F2.5]|nr:hypothetical protein FM120_08590 [Sphingobacterium faecium PCAi_F2.5]
MRPQDLVVLLKVMKLEESTWQLKNVANSLYLSASEISESLERSFYASLIDHSKRRVNKLNFLDFLLHGMKYVFPAMPGIISRGIPTGHSHPFMQEMIASREPYVWPSPDGEEIGQAIEPFYPNQIKAVKEDDELYKLLALLDVIRVGRVREINVAEKELSKLIKDVRPY